MTIKLKDLILELELNHINKATFIARLPFDLNQKQAFIHNLFNDIILFKKSDDVEFALALLWCLEEKDEFIDILHQLLMEPWHTRYEDIIHDLQKRKKTESIPYIKQAMQLKYEYLVSYSTGIPQFISQCGHALRSIGTEEAINTIIELSHSEDKEVSNAMKYRLTNF